MNQDMIEQMVRTAALEAVKEYKRVEREEIKEKIFQNTKTLMENYNCIYKSIEEGVTELSDTDNVEKLEHFTSEDNFINSILDSKLRSVIVVAGYINNCRQLESRFAKGFIWIHKTLLDKKNALF